MLSSFEADMVRRDPALPGLATALDPEALLGALRRAAPRADLSAAHITYLQYRPRRYARVTYQLDIAGSQLELDLRACRPEELGLWLENGQSSSVPGPLGPGRLVFPELALVVAVFPNDLKLAALPHLTDPAKRERVLRELLPDWPNLWDGQLRCLRYRTERRYVAELRGRDGTRALVKAYTPKACVRGRHNAQAFQSRGLLRVAQLLGSAESHRLLAFEWYPGRLLLDLCTGPEMDSSAVMAAGAALAALHAQDTASLSSWTRQAEAADLLSLSSEVGFICPELARRADELARRLAAQLAAAPACHYPLHGDFSANQVLIGQQDVAIIDLDWACCGDPADDLGNFIAQAERNALRGVLAPRRVELLRDSLLEGYARATRRPLPERIGLYTAVEVFRRMRFPFRGREPDWPQRTASLLERAEEIFNALPEVI